MAAVRVRACVRACVRARARACVRVCVCDLKFGDCHQYSLHCVHGYKYIPVFRSEHRYQNDFAPSSDGAGRSVCVSGLG